MNSNPDDFKTAHVAILNALVDMQYSVYYAARKHLLRQAEGLIVAQEKEILRLTNLLDKKEKGIEL